LAATIAGVVDGRRMAATSGATAGERLRLRGELVRRRAELVRRGACVRVGRRRTDVDRLRGLERVRRRRVVEGLRLLVLLDELDRPLGLSGPRLCTTAFTRAGVPRVDLRAAYRFAAAWMATRCRSLIPALRACALVGTG
jgi:hypothetical protein